MNASTRVATSFDAFLEIGPLSKTLSQDKFEDLALNSFGAANPFAGAAAKSASLAGSVGFISVAAGTITGQTLDNTGATTQPGEPNHCGALGGASKWFGPFQAQEDGVMIFDTIGSVIDTVLAVYTGEELETLNLVTCDNNSASDGLRSLVRFPAAQGTGYRVAIDGVNAAQGHIQLNWRLGVTRIKQGRPVTLTAEGPSAFVGSSYQWLLNGARIPGATSLTWTIGSVQSSNAGLYSVVVSNSLGLVTNLVALVKMEVPYLSFDRVLINGNLRVRLAEAATQSVVLQSSTNLTTWQSFYTNTPAAPLPSLDVPVTPQRWQFLRAIPWP